jgi:hypothetical protein
MKAIFIILSLAFFLLQFSCSNENKPTQAKMLDSVEVITDTTSFDFRCLDHTKLPQGMFFNDTTEYNKLIFCQKWFCKSDTLPFIDFSQKSLIGYWIGKGMPHTTRITKTLYKYNYTKRYVYHILTEFNYRSDTIIEDAAQEYFNFLLVKKIPTDFTVEFDSTYIDYSPW